ncbi:MAG: prepilin-type N-terminal cleavage/methylation domain-containing protein [Alphaproteobacteria bacterium]
MENPKTQAFTLIELSIVIIIIGIIIGGIAAANELIMQARIRSLVNDIQNTTTAVNAFKLKFGFLPGDFPYAGKIWTSATCTDDYATAGCNGNGDYQINLNAGGGDGQEGYRLWQHLSLGGFISGTYTGTSANTDQYKLQYSEGAYMDMRYVRPYLTRPYENCLEIGAWNSSLGLAIEGALTPYDAYGLDSKIDNGDANSGKILGRNSYSASTGFCQVSLKYNVTGTQGPFCRLRISLEY